MTRYRLPELPAVPSEVPQPGKVPLVWPTGQRGEHLVEHGYTPATSRDHLRIPPATAAYAIRAFAPRGGTVVDPDCGAGTVLVEALHCGRHAIGVTRGRRWWSLARANLSAAKRQGAATDGMVLPTSRAQDLTGRADLVLTAWRPPAGLTSSHGSHDSSDGRFSEMLTWSRDVLMPGGYLVVVARPQRRHGYLLDGPGYIHRAARAARLAPVARCIALTVPLRGGKLVTQPTWAQRRAVTRAERLAGHPVTLTAHHEVLVFRAPPATTAISATPDLVSVRISERQGTDPGVRELVGGVA